MADTTLYTGGAGAPGGGGVNGGDGGTSYPSASGVVPGGYASYNNVVFTHWELGCAASSSGEPGVPGILTGNCKWGNRGGYGNGGGGGGSDEVEGGGAGGNGAQGFVTLKFQCVSVSTGGGGTAAGGARGDNGSYSDYNPFVGI